MKKIFVFAVLLVVIGTLCAVFFTRGKEEPQTQEKPWTVAEDYSETTAPETTEAPAEDAVAAFSDYIHTTLRKSYAFLSEAEHYPQDALQNALLGTYIYDVDGDGTEDLSVVCIREDGVCLDLYRFADKRVQFADSVRLRLDPMNEIDFALALSDFAHIAARMTIYPDGSDRYFCLTAEQSDKLGDYNAYTVVLKYAKGKLSVRKSFRLRQRGDVVTLMCTDNVTLLYSSAAEETAAKYSELAEAFRAEFGKLGLSAPQVTIESGKLTQYKVTPVEHAQNVFDLDAEKAVTLTENGFLQSFILNV